MPRGLSPVCLILLAAGSSLAQTGRADRALPVPAASTQPATQLPLPVLTATERLHDYLQDLVSPVSFLSAAAGAGIGQWRNSPTEWKQGAEGYGKRFASGYAQHLAGATILFGASALFREDNRFVRSQPGAGFGGRVGNALENTLLSRRVDSHGQTHRRLSISRVIAFVGAAYLSRAWQPQSTSSLRSAGINIGASVGASAGLNVAREFLPWLPLQ